MSDTTELTIQNDIVILVPRSRVETMFIPGNLTVEQMYRMFQFRLFTEEELGDFETVELQVPLKNTQAVWRLTNTGFASTRPIAMMPMFKVLMLNGEVRYIRADSHFAVKPTFIAPAVGR